MYYITVSNGLLTPEHKRKMGIAIWEFEWCLDKITKIDNEGLGYVLGGKPINLSDIGMGHYNTTSRNLARLEKYKYIKLTRTPRGLIIRVCRAKKAYQKKSDSSTSMNHQPRGSDSSLLNNDSSNMMNLYIDNTIDNTRYNTSWKSNSFNSIDLELATLLKDEIIKNQPSFKEPDLPLWAKHIRLMREQDKRTPEQIRIIIKWCQMSDFWRANILSGKKLRERFDTLVAQMSREIRAKQSKRASVIL